MDSWLKALVAGACCVVIAGGANYAWGAYASHTARAERQANISAARQELFGLADAKPYEPEKVRKFCNFMESREDDGIVGAWVNNCRALGYL